jgi:hypothetical protein
MFADSLPKRRKAFGLIGGEALLIRILFCLSVDYIQALKSPDINPYTDLHKRYWHSSENDLRQSGHNNLSIFMKNSIIVCLIAGIALSACSEDSIRSSDAKNHKGQMKTIKGIVADYREAHEPNKPHYINLGREFPNQDITIVTYGNFEAKYKHKLKSLKGKTIIIRGTIAEFKGRLQIKKPLYINVEK